MSDATFLDNQEVTAQDLNDIAIDLGYADYSHFPEETPPSAVSALNQITADLVTPGILLTGNRCEVTYSDGIIYVDTGIIVFESGAKKRIESIQQLQALKGTSCVYALNDTINNTISLKCSEEFPTEGDFAKLAIVSDGLVTSERVFSTSKVSIPVMDGVEEFTLNGRREIDFGKPYNNIILISGSGNCSLYNSNFYIGNGGTLQLTVYYNNNKMTIRPTITIKDGLFKCVSNEYVGDYHGNPIYLVDYIVFKVF